MKDLVVAGASIGGLYSAYHAVKEGADVVMFDRKRDLGEFRCAEGVMDDILAHGGVPIRDGWISNRVRTLVVHLPSGQVHSLTARSRYAYILNRDVLQREIAEMLESMGVEVLTGERVRSFSLGKGRLSTSTRELKAAHFIDATGVVCALGRWVIKGAGLPERDQSAVLMQSRVRSADLPDDELHIYFGSRYSCSHGYGWVFPKGDGTFNAGVGRLTSIAADIKGDLKRFLRRVLRGYTVLSTVGSVLPVTSPVERLWASENGHNLLLVGDAARMCIAVTGAGIGTALMSGMYAGRHYTEPETYERRMKPLVRKLRRLHRIRERYMEEKKLERLVRRVLKTAAALHRLFPNFVERKAFSRWRI